MLKAILPGRVCRLALTGSLRVNWSGYGIMDVDEKPGCIFERHSVQVRLPGKMSKAQKEESRPAAMKIP